MRRREFITLFGGVTVAPSLFWPRVARAQQPRRVGLLINGAETEMLPPTYVAAFVQEMRQLGWIDGQNIRFDLRWNGGDAELARTYAAQLVGLHPDVLLIASTTNLQAIRAATSTIPVVFTQISDPVVQGFVKSMTQPGGNLTGFSSYEFAVGGKWLDLLKEVSPSLGRVALVFNPDTSPQSRFFMRSVEAAASALGVQAISLQLHRAADIEPALERFAREPNGGVILPTDTFVRMRQKEIADLAAHYRLPTISAGNDFAQDGGLMYYGSNINLVEQYRQAASYVDRILKGAKPGELPIQGADKYTLVINLKTAKVLGLTVPLPLLGLADEVIE